MKSISVIVAAMLLLLCGSATALAEWPGSTEGDQYAGVNGAMQTAVAGVGLSSSTFVAIYDAAAAGDVSGFTDTQLAAACEVMKELSAYESVLEDYSTVYANLGCSTLSTAPAASSPARSSLPNTGVALALLLGSGVAGIGAATHMLRKSK